MFDLISRSEVLELLYKIFDEYYMSTDKNPSIISKSFGTDSFGIDVFKKIKEMPTSYDIDKVVEELELHSFELGTDTFPVHYLRLNKAIEIVKQGGDDNDVCECRKLKDYRSLFKTSCGYIFAREGFKYCPYCGKKIKVVEQMNKRQWKKQGTKLKHNGHYASYVALFLGIEIKGKPHLDKKWLKR